MLSAFQTVYVPDDENVSEWIWKDVEGSGRGLFECVSAFTWRYWG